MRITEKKRNEENKKDTREIFEKIKRKGVMEQRRIKFNQRQRRGKEIEGKQQKSKASELRTRTRRECIWTIHTFCHL